MSLWNSFKKKINDQWSASDWWDKDENRQQKIQAAQPVVQQTPAVRTAQPSLRVEVARPQQNVEIAQPDPTYQMKNLQVGSAPRQELVMPNGVKVSDIKRTPEEQLAYDVDTRLDAGKSWEDIAADVRIPVDNVRQYSQATRPNYGIAKPEYKTGISGFFEKAGDKLEANSPQDQYKRREQGAQEKYDGTQFWQKGRDLGVGAVREIAKVPETVYRSIDKGMDETAANDIDRALAEKDPAKRKKILGDTADPREGWFTAGKTKMLDPNMSDEDLIKLRDEMRGSQNSAPQYHEGAKRFLYGSEPVQTYQQRYRGVKEEFKTNESAAQKYLKGQGDGGKELAETISRNAGPLAATLAVIGVGADVIPDPTDLIKAPAKKTGKEIITDLSKKSGDDLIENAAKNSNLLTKPDSVKILNETADDAGSVIHLPKQGVYAKVTPDQLKVLTDEVNNIPFTADDIVHLTAGPNVRKAATEVSQDEIRRMSANASTALDNATPKPVQLQGATMPKPNSTKSIAELMPNLDNRVKLAVDPVDELAKKYGVKPETVKKLQNQYGEDIANSVLARSSDATNIRNMDAFVVSEAKKNYTPKVNVQPGMSAEELASLERSAPPVKIASPEPQPVLKVEPEAPVIKAAPAQSNLGNMAQKFYDSRAGDQPIRFRDLERLGQDISKQVDADFKAIGSSYVDVARKVQEAARNGVRSLDEAGLTPAEASILRNAQEEMNYIRRRASTGKKEVGAGDFGEMYIPQQKVGQNAGERLFEGFREQKPGTEFSRKNQIDLEDLDYSPDVIGEYITRYGDTKLYKRERLARALAKNNPDVDPDTLAAATDKLIAVQDKVNSIKSKIGAFGFGTRQQIDETGKFVDSADEMSGIGKTLGKTQEVITDEPRGLTNGDRINSIAIDGQPLGDRLGLNQYRDAQNYASKQVIDAGGDRDALAASVAQRLEQNYNISPDEIDYAVNGIANIAPTVPDEVLLARVHSTYRAAAKQQLLEQLQGVDIKNAKLRKDVSNLTNQILREGSIESELSEKVIRGVLRTQNAIFRKLNVSSSINELSDLNSFISVYGRNTALAPDFSTIKEFGLGEIDAAIEPYLRQVADGSSVTDVLKSINSKTNLYKFVEHYKAGVLATSAKNFYMKQGLQGDALAARVLDDYRKLALPVDAFTKTFLDNAPLYTQYMTWGVRNLQKEGRLATGKISSGVLDDMTTKQRIARNAYANIPAKTVFWLSSNALKGTSILTAFGLTDFTGLTNQDYSGIAEEDKSWFDRTTQFTNSSTTLSMLNGIVQAYEKEQLKEKYKDADYNPYEDTNFGKDVANKYTPQFIKNVTGTNDMLEKGYSENKKGRVQYEAPDDFWNTAKSYLFGKGQTDNARDYSGREDIFRRDNLGGVIDMAKEQIGLKETDYDRPLTEAYSKAYKEAEEGARTALLQGGRQYNDYLDDLKKNNKPAYDAYIGAMDGNHVNPEYWKQIAGGDPGKSDLATFNMVKNRKKQEAKDLGKKYDPIYDLTDDQARSVLQQKSVATGDDIALRNALYKEQWYKDYQKKVKDYYDTKEETDSDFTQTQRVRDWYGINDQYNSLRSTTKDDGSKADWAKEYPTVYQQKIITDTYGFGSEEGKAWFKANGDQYMAEKALYDAANLALINKMRAIEGYPAMSADQYKQVTKIADTDTSDDKKGGKSGGGSYAKEGNYGQKRALSIPSVKIEVGKVKIQPKNAPKTVKIKREKAKM